MHPIERLRMVARAAGEGPALLAQEAAGALAAFADDPAGLVTACRRLVDRQPTSGPLWWLAARVLAASDPTAEAWRSADLLNRDPTAKALAAALPDDVVVCVVGWPTQASGALVRRGDVAVLAVDCFGEALGLVRRLRSAGGDATLVGEFGMGAAAAASDLVLLETSAVGPSGFVALAGSHAVAAVAGSVGVPVWLVAGEGCVLPGPLWESLSRRLASDVPWDESEEIVPLRLVDRLVGPGGLHSVDEALAHVGCPTAPELLREVS